MRTCENCHQAPIPKHHRRYCAVCSPLASKLWKARNRRLWVEAWRSQGCRGPAPYLDGWESREAYRAYYRSYMRAWRRKRRAHEAQAAPADCPAEQRPA